MRRVTAQFAFVAIWIGFLGPAVATAEETGLHACCLRSGVHHCQESSGAPGFQSKNTCPYSSPVPFFAAFSGWQVAKFTLAVPQTGELLAPKIAHRVRQLTARELSARGPPSLL